MISRSFYSYNMLNQNYKTVDPNAFIERLKKLKSLNRDLSKTPKALFFTDIRILSKPNG